jgi:hypothetical protein
MACSGTALPLLLLASKNIFERVQAILFCAVTLSLTRATFWLPGLASIIVPDVFQSDRSLVTSAILHLLKFIFIKKIGGTVWTGVI